MLNRNFSSLLRMGWTCLAGSVKVIFYLYRNTVNYRSLVNHEIRRRAAKILQLAKIKAELIIENNFQLNSKVPYIYMSNHTSLLDIPLIYHLLPGSIRFIAKQKLFEIPVFGHAIRKAGIVSAKDQHLFQNIKKMLNDGISIWLFPEGQRSATGDLLNFKAGGFSLARETGATIIPVAICGTRTALPKGNFMLKQGVHVIMRLGHPIDANRYKNIEQQPQLIHDVRNTINNLIKQSSMEQRREAALLPWQSPSIGDSSLRSE